MTNDTIDHLKRWGLFEKGSLQFIIDVEQKIKDHPMWKKLCLAASKDNSNCSMQAFISPVSLLQDQTGKVNMSAYTQDEVIDKYDDFLNNAKDDKNPAS